MDDSSGRADARTDAVTGKELSPKAKLGVAIVFSIISLCLAFVMADRGYTEAMILLGKRIATGTTTKVETTKSKSTTSYWVSYSFAVDGKDYERTSLFGAMKQGTKIFSAEREAYVPGSPIEIAYSSLNPSVNYPTRDPYRNDKSIFLVIGCLLFGLVAANEFKGRLKKG
jgi:hypothetical protein